MINYDGVLMPVHAIPDAVLRASLGVGHFPSDVRAREVYTGRTFPYSPEVCPTDVYGAEWINSHLLVCLGCGLDCT